MVAERWMLEGRDVAVATVVETWGSAPRPVGSHLVIDAEGNFEGSVSGGCVEGAVISDALDVIETGEPKMLEFGVADETAWRVGLSCGGRSGSMSSGSARGSMDPLSLKKLNAARAARKAIALVTDLGDGRDRLVEEGDPVAGDLGEALAEGISHRQVRRWWRSMAAVLHQCPCAAAAPGGDRRGAYQQAMAPMAKWPGFDVGSSIRARPLPRRSASRMWTGGRLAGGCAQGPPDRPVHGAGGGDA
jgi:hypothetical protein